MSTIHDLKEVRVYTKILGTNGSIPHLYDLFFNPILAGLLVPLHFVWGK